MRFRSTRRRAAALAGAAVAATALVALSVTRRVRGRARPEQRHADPFHLAKVGPVNQLDGLPDGDPLHDPSANGFPYWYSDGTDALELCLDKPHCGAATTAPSTGVLPIPDAPITFPQVQDGPHNFPDEAFYWMGTGGGDDRHRRNAGKSLVVMALEAAFANGTAAAGRPDGVRPHPHADRHPRHGRRSTRRVAVRQEDVRRASPASARST